jgi:GTPase SAR1 family protein
MECHKQRLEEMRKESEAREKKYEEERKLEQQRNKEILERIEKEKDEEKRKRLEEEQRKVEEAKKMKEDFQKRVEDIKIDKVEKIKKQLKAEEKTFCLGEISKFDKEKISLLIRDLFKSEKIISFTNKILKNLINDSKKEVKQVEHLNIVVVGPSGVGKSTLINAVLDSENLTPEGFGKPMSQDTNFFTSEKVPFFRLADSKGIEKNAHCGVEVVLETIKNFIKSQLDTKEPDNFIHCIWYCWTGARLEDSEIDLLNKLTKVYTSETLPVIIVYTNAIDPEQNEKAKNYVLNQLKFKNNFIDVLSKEKEIVTGIKIPQRNIDLLREVTIKSAKTAINSSCYEGLIEDIKSRIKSLVEDLSEKLNNKIKNEIKTKISKMDEKNNFEDLYKENENMIRDIFFKYVYQDPDFKFGDKDQITFDSTSKIREFVESYFKETLNIYDRNLELYLEKWSNELVKEINEFQFQFIKNSDIKFECPWKTDIELKKILRDFIYKTVGEKMQLYCIKNSYRFIAGPIIEKFRDFFYSVYLKGLNNKDFIREAKNLTGASFDKIEEKIKSYHQKLAANSEAPAKTPLDKESKNSSNSTMDYLDELEEEETPTKS